MAIKYKPGYGPPRNEAACLCGHPYEQHSAYAANGECMAYDPTTEKGWCACKRFRLDGDKIAIPMRVTGDKFWQPERYGLRTLPISKDLADDLGPDVEGELKRRIKRSLIDGIAKYEKDDRWPNWIVPKLPKAPEKDFDDKEFWDTLDKKSQFTKMWEMVVERRPILEADEIAKRKRIEARRDRTRAEQGAWKMLPKRQEVTPIPRTKPKAKPKPKTVNKLDLTRVHPADDDEV